MNDVDEYIRTIAERPATPLPPSIASLVVSYGRPVETVVSSKGDVMNKWLLDSPNLPCPILLYLMGTGNVSDELRAWLTSIAEIRLRWRGFERKVEGHVFALNAVWRLDAERAICTGVQPAWIEEHLMHVYESAFFWHEWFNWRTVPGLTPEP